MVYIMEKILSKNKINTLCKAQAECVDSPNSSNKDGLKHSVCAALGMSMMVLAVLLITTQSAFAADTVTSASGNAIVAAVDSGMHSLWVLFKAIVTPIAVIALCVCIAGLFGGSEKTISASKAKVMGVALGIILIFLAPSLVSMVVEWFSSASTWITTSGAA